MGRRFLLAVTMVVLGALPVAAQLDTSRTPIAESPWVVFGSDKGYAPVVITGGYRVLGQTSNRQGSFQEKPPDLWRAELNPSMSVYGIPLTANILVSSEQEGIRQDINAFSLTLDPEAVQRIVVQRAYNALESYAQSESAELLSRYDEVRDSLAKVNPERLKELEQYRQLEQLRDVSKGDIDGYGSLLNQMGLMNDVESIMAKMPTIGVGTLFPTFTPITMSGVRLKGASLEWNPGFFYIHVAGGETQRPLLRFDTTRVDSGLIANFDQSAYGRTLYAARIGVGRRDGEHLMVTGIYATDDVASISFADTNTALTPQRNYLGALDFKIEPLPGIWSLQGEVGGSLTVGDLNAPRFGTKDVPGFLLDAVDSSASTYFDFAVTAQTEVNVQSTGTRLRGTFRRIGPGYKALAVPNLRTDILRYDFRADQALWKRQLSLGAFYRRDQDNLLPWKRSTTTITSLGGSVGLNIRQWPYLRVSYAPYAQVNDATDTLQQFNNRSTILNANAGYNYKVGDVGMGTNLSYGLQDATTLRSVSDYSVRTINITQNASFAFPLSASLGLGFITQTAAGAPDNTITTIDMSASYGISDMVNVGGGLTFALDNTFGDRVGYFLSVGGNLWDLGYLDIRAERNVFNERIVPPVYGGTYLENILRVSISRNW